MPNKLQAYAEQAERTARQITGSHLAWTAFLTTAARLYKYPYNEQLMIYMQRPEATACAEYDFWNEKMGRYVRRGSTGIALIDATGYKPRLKYVFDVSDTGGKENARRVNLWELKDAHTDSVSAMLERNYGVSGKNGLAEQFESVASQLAAEYWRDHSRDILGIVADSYLEEYDDYNIEVAFKNAAAVSITYSLMSRCGMQPEDHFEHEDFSASLISTPRARWQPSARRSARSMNRFCGRSKSPYEIMSANTARKGRQSMENNLTYTMNGDYMIPDLKIEVPEQPLGKYGRMRQKYLKEHRPILWNQMILEEALFPHLLEIEQAAQSRLEQMMPELAAEAGATEALKARDPMKWVGLMNACKAQAEEVILAELIYA